ncbi:MAG TPA: response regulator transcription factor [Steroidobacteraceae bacterium]|nr:response regulator transcription factor [Steroidobacteraceae bacterium]
MAESPTIRILLVDDHAVVRAGYRRFLELEPGYAVVGEASSAEEAYALLQAGTPDLVVLDLSMPGQGGLSLLRRLKLRWPLLPVLVFSMHDHPAFAIQAMRAGASGYVTKSSDPQVVVQAVRAVMSGGHMMSPDIEAKLARESAPGQGEPMLGLSSREFDVFRLIASGASHEDIASLLKVSVKTVANNHSIIRQKLGISSDIELLKLALDCGAVEAHPAKS